MVDLPHPLILAHRGASARAPENTLVAFALARAEGAHGVELDAKLSADGQVVVIHDSTLDRTTDGHGRVNARNLVVLRELDAGTRFAPQFRGERIPLLDEVLETLGPDLWVNIELTNYTSPTDALVERVARVVTRHAALERVIFSSFLAGNLRRVRRLLPDALTAMLAWKGWAGFLARGKPGQRVAPRILHPHISDTSEALIIAAHRRGQRVHAWTVNQPDDMRRLLDWGVDGLITDDPALALSLVQERA